MLVSGRNTQVLQGFLRRHFDVREVTESTFLIVVKHNHFYSYVQLMYLSLRDCNF
jgi:hypothetical protein